MKTLLVAEKETTREALKGHLTPLGFDLIHYRHPVKAMDNLDEIEPDLVLFSAEDFPRHWKPFIKLLRQGRTREETAFVLLTSESFAFEEAAKAEHLDVNAILSENPQDRDEIRKLEDIVTRYSTIKEERTDLRYLPSERDNIEFLFSHPKNYRLVTGVLFDLSPRGAAFIPDDPKATADIPSGTTIFRCSIRIEQARYHLACRVVRNSTRMALKFLDPSAELEELIIEFIDRRAERELELLLQDR